MSMPHDCICRTCGKTMGMAASATTTTLEEIEAAQLSARVNRQAGIRLLAGAILKIAPEEAAAIAKRWEEVQHNERLALDEFLSALRSTETQEKNDAGT